MRRFGISLAIFLLCLFLIFLLATSSVKRSSYYAEDYYTRTVSRLDSISKVISVYNDSLQAGFARVSITPVLSSSGSDWEKGIFTYVPLAGYGGRKGRPATGIHDSLFIRAVALKAGGKLVILVTADLLIMPPNITDTISLILSKKGITREQLFFSAIHCHSSLGGWGPGFIGKQFAGSPDKGIQKWIVIKTCESVLSAIDDLKPAKVATGCFDAAGYTRNRFIGESGTKNNDFCFISIEQIGAERAIIGSFSAHATALGEDNMEISADYPGYWSRRMESTSADIALFFAGATGSQSLVAEGDGFGKAEWLGEALADSLNSVLKGIPATGKPDFSYVSLKIHLPEYHIRLTKKINLSTFVSKKLMPLPENVYLQAMRIGKMVWITTPGDFSGEYALQLKNALLAEGFIGNVSSFNGSYAGYIVPGKYFYLNEYESGLMGWFGPNMGDYTMEMIRQITRIVTGSDNI